MNSALIVLGPTSTGKTDLALNLAQKFNGELVSCDSRQVYTGLDIGTGKMPSENGELRIENKQSLRNESLKQSLRSDNLGKWIVNGIPIHMYDVVDPKRQYTVYDYVKEADRVIGDITRRGKLPIIVGGTGLYLKALLEGLPSLIIPINQKLRKQLEKLSLSELQLKLQKISLSKWNEMNNSDRQNPRRLIRAIEIMQNLKFKTQSSKLQLKIQNYHILKIGLTAPREILYQRIDERVLSRMDQGLVEEAEKLHKQGLSLERMRQLGLEYGVLADYLEGKITDKPQVAKVLQGKIHSYARRQITWFKREKDVFWFDITENGWFDRVESQVDSWYYSLDDKKN